MHARNIVGRYENDTYLINSNFVDSIDELLVDENLNPLVMGQEYQIRAHLVERDIERFENTERGERKRHRKEKRWQLKFTPTDSENHLKIFEYEKWMTKKRRKEIGWD